MSPQRPAQTVDWLIIVRPIGVSAILGVGTFILWEEPTKVIPLALLVLITYALSLLYWFALRKRVPFRPFVWAQLSTDVVLATAIVGFSGGAESQFSLLYFVPVICGAMFLIGPGSFTMALLSSISYSLLLVSEYHNYFQWLQPNVDVEYVRNYIFLRGYMHVLFFFVVAAMGTYLAERTRRGVQELEEVKLTTDDILENMGAGVITIDATGQIIYFNWAAGVILDCESGRVRGRMLEEVVPGGAKSLTRLVLEGLSARRNEHRREIDIRLSDGQIRPVGVSCKVMEDKKGRCRGYLVLFSDLTDVKETQERLKRSERMAAIGELSADMAHEIRNPLASIRGSVETLASETYHDGDSKKLMGLVIKEADRLNTIIEHFLKFARTKAPSFRKVSLNRVIEEVLDLVKAHPDFREAIELRTVQPVGDAIVKADPEQVKQVFLNLCLNSLSAMKDSGQLTVEVLQTNGAFGVAVQDTGVGIDKSVITRIFQPFYTTRKKGIGLGLSIAHKIVEKHKGWIDVESSPGKGSKFTVWLPKFDSGKEGE